MWGTHARVEVTFSVCGLHLRTGVESGRVSDRRDALVNDANVQNEPGRREEYVTLWRTPKEPLSADSEWRKGRAENVWDVGRAVVSNMGFPPTASLSPV